VAHVGQIVILRFTVKVGDASADDGKVHTGACKIGVGLTQAAQAVRQWSFNCRTCAGGQRCQNCPGQQS